MYQVREVENLNYTFNPLTLKEVITLRRCLLSTMSNNNHLSSEFINMTEKLALEKIKIKSKDDNDYHTIKAWDDLDVQLIDKTHIFTILNDYLEDTLSFLQASEKINSYQNSNMA